MNGTDMGAKDPLRLARALVQPLILALGTGDNRVAAYP